MPDRPSDFETFIGPDRRKFPRPKGLAAVVSIIAVALLIGLAALFPATPPDVDLTTFGFADETVTATVASSLELPCSFAAELTCRPVEFAFVGADGSTRSFIQEFTTDQGSPVLVEGDRVLLSVIKSDGAPETYQYYDRDRTSIIVVIGVIFGLAVVGLGRLRGAAALAGLFISLVLLFWFIVPAITAGEDAVLVALVGGGLIALVALYLAHGYTPLTHVAAVGAFAALALTTGLSWLSVTMAQFTGLATEESFYLLGLPGLDPGGLLLAGIVLGSLGALDDVTVTQASAVWEVNAANPNLTAAELFASGLRLGRDHIASTVNTLLLAYAGAALPLLLLFSLSALPLGVIASSEVVAVEIVRTLVGSIGLVAAVPITTWLASRQVIRAR